MIRLKPSDITVLNDRKLFVLKFRSVAYDMTSETFLKLIDTLTRSMKKEAVGKTLRPLEVLPRAAYKQPSLFEPGLREREYE